MTAHQPTNEDILASFDEHTKEDHRFQEETRLFNEGMASFQAETEGTLADMHATLKAVPTKEDTKEIVSAVISELLLSRSTLAFKSLIVIAKIVAALGIILGGLKLFVALIGYHLTK